MAWKQIWQWIVSMFKRPDKQEEEGIYIDDIDVAVINRVTQGIDWRQWPARYDLTATRRGDGVNLDQTITRRLESVDDNVGSVWCIVSNGLGYTAFRFDQIRAGQMHRDELPWRPKHPRPGHGNYMTLHKADEAFICVTSMARDHKRNGDVRTRIARLV